MIFKKGDIYRNTETNILIHIKEERNNEYLMYWKISDQDINHWYSHKELLREMTKGYIEVIQYGGGIEPSRYLEKHYIV